MTTNLQRAALGIDSLHHAVHYDLYTGHFSLYQSQYPKGTLMACIIPFPTGSSLANGARIRNPFTGSTRPILLKRESSTPHTHRHAKQQNVLLHFLPDGVRQRKVHVTAHAQSGPAADNSAQSTQPVLKQSLSKPAVSQSSAIPEQKPVTAKLGTLWGLLICAIAYVHHSTTG